MSELKITQRALHNIGQYLGIRNRNEILEATKPEEEIPQDDLKTKEIAVPLYAREKLSQNERELIADIRLLCQKTSIAFEDAFLVLISEYQEAGGRLSDTMLEKMQELGLGTPQFEIYAGTNREDLLQKLHFSQNRKLKDESIVVLFNLPKPLAQYWWKGGTKSWGYQGKDVNGMSIEWGHFYRELMPVIWKAVGHETCETNAQFSRINPVGEHKALEYYYIWEVSREEES